MEQLQVRSAPDDHSGALVAAAAALADADAQVSGETRCEVAVWVADAERHMRLATSWLSRVNAADGPIVLESAHELVGSRRALAAVACPCGIFLDAGCWYLPVSSVVSVIGLPARGRDAHCDGECRSRWLVSLQDSAARIEMFTATRSSRAGVVVRANADSIDIATPLGVVTYAAGQIAAVHVRA